MLKTFGEIVKLGDLPQEEKEQIREAIIYSAEHEAEFYSDVNKTPLDENKTSMTYTRSYLPEIDKTSDRYKNGLVEGETPDPEKINEADFTVPVNENGWYYRFTRKTLNHAYRNVKTTMTKYLQNIFNSYHDEKIADTYLSSANIVTSIDLLKLEDLLKLNTILFKNKATTFEGGFYKLRVGPEIADKMLVAYKDIITHTTQKESVVSGEIGEIGGFRIIKSRLQAFQVSSGKGKFVAYGLTQKGEYPVGITSYDDLNAEIIYHKPGTNGNDELNQRGSLGLFVDGHGFYMFDDSICVTGEATISGLTSVDVFDNSKRSNLVSETIAASNLYPDVTVFELAKSKTHTLVVTDENGTDITSSCTFESSNTDVATVDNTTTKGKVTAVKQGTARIVISKGDAANVVTVKVTNA